MVNVLTDEQIRRLMSFAHVADVESDGMDDDRFFVHLDSAHRWNQDPSLGIHSKAFSSYKDARYWVEKKVIANTAEGRKGW